MKFAAALIALVSAAAAAAVAVPAKPAVIPRDCTPGQFLCALDKFILQCDGASTWVAFQACPNTCQWINNSPYCV
jgi:hypothetical protein